MSARHFGDRSPTEAEVDEHRNPKTLGDLRSQLGEAQAWLRKIREALGVETNAHALAIAKSVRRERVG